jgi:hypothetical protein
MRPRPGARLLLPLLPFLFPTPPLAAHAAAEGGAAQERGGRGGGESIGRTGLSVILLSSIIVPRSCCSIVLQGGCSTIYTQTRARAYTAKSEPGRQVLFRMAFLLWLSSGVVAVWGRVSHTHMHTHTNPTVLRQREGGGGRPAPLVSFFVGGLVWSFFYLLHVVA